MKYFFLCTIGAAFAVLVVAGTIRLIKEIFKK